ncbi:hypothetical protein H6G11_03125 [Cyanobacterium aponinum FACHB-4101]|uniref:PfkB family carbohydrate kinase n=1 Tax=Cyanobacterium aponinum TaxID=379064 RepID=UPI0016802467|nr:PfkB family carbohydrate kinase [Cyanobacterium aponinum]MBD2393244.1 hypothetical protein [Cyanobacterium aponinum FACHB-4101]
MNKILAIGEALFDFLPHKKVLGGAPVNFSVNCVQLGAEVTLLTRIGQDILGAEIVKNLHQKGVSSDYIQWDQEKETGKVIVNLTKSGEPSYFIKENVAWDYLALDHNLLNNLHNYQVLYFGTLAQRNTVSRQTINTIISQFKGIKFLDLNLRNPIIDQQIILQSIYQTNILKLNLFEAEYLINHLNFDRNLSTWLNNYQLDLIILTQGEKGTKWIDKTGEYSGEISRAKKDVNADSVGAGDGISAAIITGYLQGLKSLEIIAKANKIGAYIASHSGAIVILNQFQ